MPLTFITDIQSKSELGTHIKKPLHQSIWFRCLHLTLLSFNSDHKPTERKELNSCHQTILLQNILRKAFSKSIYPIPPTGPQDSFQIIIKIYHLDTWKNSTMPLRKIELLNWTMIRFSQRYKISPKHCTYHWILLWEFPQGPINTDKLSNKKKLKIHCSKLRAPWEPTTNLKGTNCPNNC